MSSENASSARSAWGYGIITQRNDGTVLDARFNDPQLGELPANRDPWIVPAELAADTGSDELRNVSLEPITLQINLDDAPTSTADAYLRLQLLSHRIVLPNTINLDGIFGHLPNVVWTNHGPIHPDDYTERMVTLQRHGISAHSIDKFPRLVDYLVPSGVRIADANRVRLGAYLSPGTTIMHEGFVNFNAGTLGPAMVEGRISQGVVIGADSDIGGGASIMGTLSGGGKEKITVGSRSLLGANSGIGISIGDDTIVEAGLYLTAGAKVAIFGVIPARPDLGGTVKASELSGVSGVLFRRNSETGSIEAVNRSGAGVQLNQQLHA